METADGILTQIDGVSPAHGRFYLLQSCIFKAINDTVQYYKSALKFLGCTKITDLPLDEQRDHAKHLSVAALVSDGIYNFGELVSNYLYKKSVETSIKYFLVGNTYCLCAYHLNLAGSSDFKLSGRDQGQVVD